MKREPPSLPPLTLSTWIAKKRGTINVTVKLHVQDRSHYAIVDRSILEKKKANNFINYLKAALKGSRMCIFFISIVLLKVTFHLIFRCFQSSQYNMLLMFKLKSIKFSSFSVSSFIIDRQLSLIYSEIHYLLSTCPELVIIDETLQRKRATKHLL